MELMPAKHRPFSEKYQLIFSQGWIIHHSSPSDSIQAVDSTDFEVIFTISGSLPSGTQQVNRGVPEPEDLRCEGKLGSFWGGTGETARNVFLV